MKKPKTDSSGPPDSRSGADACDEMELFRRAMAGVVPVEGKRRAVRPGAGAERADNAAEAARTAEKVGLRGPGPRLLKKLRRGGFRVEEDLDLHGLTRAEARRELDLFLRESAARGLRCVLVVHGRGLSSAGREPVLKRKVPEWLADPKNLPLVAAFAPALPRDGGPGAVYVLLRRAVDRAGGRR